MWLGRGLKGSKQTMRMRVLHSWTSNTTVTRCQHTSRHPALASPSSPQLPHCTTSLPPPYHHTISLHYPLVAISSSPPHHPVSPLHVTRIRCLRSRLGPCPCPCPCPSPFHRTSPEHRRNADVDVAERVDQRVRAVRTVRRGCGGVAWRGVVWCGRRGDKSRQRGGKDRSVGC